jgi:hypothetical protein
MLLPPQYPDYADRVVLSVKGGMDAEKGVPGGPVSRWVVVLELHAAPLLITGILFVQR